MTHPGGTNWLGSSSSQGDPCLSSSLSQAPKSCQVPASAAQGQAQLGWPHSCWGLVGEGGDLLPWV